MASLGKSSFGRHDTRDLSTGVESGGASARLRIRRHAESGHQRDSVQCRAPRRRARSHRLDYPDLMVHQTEYQSSCATVLMLDCSHSMILYGEDRFTPAKK